MSILARDSAEAQWCWEQQAKVCTAPRVLCIISGRAKKL